MQEIKYRAWDKLENNMKLVKSINYADDGFAGTILVHLVGGKTHGYVHGESCELLKFTGLKDKNGKEIYEGDILKDGDIITEVVFRDFTWQEKLISSPHNHRSNYFPFDYEIRTVATIIGNIYVNPDLVNKR